MWLRPRGKGFSSTGHVAKATRKRVFILQMWWPVRGWGTPPEREGKSPHLYPAHRKGGPNAPLFRYPASGPLSGWLVARLFLSGDVERNPGPGKKWLCTLCNLATHQTKSQTSIRCNHTTIHWVHLTCTNLTQYTNTWKCTRHSTHTTQTQPSQKGLSTTTLLARSARGEAGLGAKMLGWGAGGAWRLGSGDPTRAEGNSTERWTSTVRGS